MMRHKFKLKPSKILAVLLVFLFAGGEFCLVATGFGWSLTGLFMVLYGIGFCYFWRHHMLLRDEHMIVKLWRTSVHNSWSLVDGNSFEYVAKLLPSSVVTSFVMILHFNVDQLGYHKFIPVLIFRDMQCADDFRRLRVQVITGRND